MKRAISFLLAMALLALLCCSCGKAAPFSPELILADGYILEGETIRASFYNMDYVDIYSDIKASSGIVRLYSSRELDEYFEGDELDLEDGENVFCLFVGYGGESRLYDVVIKNTMIVGLAVEEKYERVYGIGDTFDRDSIKVTAELFAGGTAEINDYDAEFAFDSEGEKTVRITCGGYVCNFPVKVEGRHTPTLDENRRDASGAVYEINGDKAILANGTSVGGYFTVPETVIFGGKEYSVSEIKDYAFYGNNSLTGVSAGEVTVGEAAFCACNELKTALFGENAVLSGYVFKDCPSLEKVVLPSGITEVPDGLFSGCGSLSEIELPDGVKRIGHQAFESCISLEEIILSQKTEYIGRRAFAYCEKLTRAFGGISLGEIDDGAFSLCPSLRLLAVPSSCVGGEGILSGSPDCTVCSGNSSRIMQSHIAAGGDGRVVEEDAATILKCKDRFPLGGGISNSDIDVLLYTDVYFGLEYDFGIDCDLTVPGERRVRVLCGDYAADTEVYVEYEVMISGTMDSDGAEYSVDRASGTATLIKLPENLSFGRFVVPTSISDGERSYPVTAIAGGAITHPLLEKLFIHSDIRLIEDGAIKDCPQLSLVYCGARSGAGLTIGDGNLEGIPDDTVILCDTGDSPMQRLALEKSLVYAGLETDALYFLPRRGAKNVYSAGEKFDFSGYAITYVASGFDVTTLTENDVVVEYDFAKNGTVRISYRGLTAEITVTVR